MALAWVLRRPEISTAILGATSIQQLEENLKGCEIKLEPEDWQELEVTSRGTPPKPAEAPKPPGAPKARAATKSKPRPR